MFLHYDILLLTPVRYIVHAQKLSALSLSSTQALSVSYVIGDQLLLQLQLETNV